MTLHASPRLTALVRAALLGFAAAILTFIFTGIMWSDSVDLAHHYALVVRLAEHGNAPFPHDPSLGEMNVYPRLAHQMAASAGRWYASSLMGMQTLATLSLVLVWAGLAWLIASLPWRTAAMAAAALAALLAANRYTLRMPLYGDELIGNFFFPQLLGQMLCIAFILFCLYLERKAVAAWLRHALLVPVVYVLAGVHLLPALILLSVVAGVMGTELLMLWRQKRPGLAVAGGMRAGLLLTALGVLASHPAVEAMRAISKQNGGMALPYLNSTASLMAYSVAIALASAALLLYWARRQRETPLLALKYIGWYGLAVSGLCLAQGLAILFGLGSEYAVRKYVFSLDTVALIELALLPALLLSRKAEAALAPSRHAMLLYCALPAALMALACVTITSRPAVYQTRQLVALERNVVALRDRLAPVEAGNFNYVVGAGGGSAMVEYMLSLGHFHVSRMENSNAASLLFQRELDNWPAVAGIVTAENSGFDRAPACRRGAPLAGLVALDAGCLLRQASAGTRIDFTEGNKIFPCTLSGFSRREAAGTWTESSQATLRCPLARVNGKAPGRVEITASAFGDGVAGQRVVLTVDGGVAPQRTTFGASGSQTLSLALGGNTGRDIVIRFALPDAVSPQQLGLSGDTRTLGLFVQAIEFKDPAW